MYSLFGFFAKICYNYYVMDTLSNLNCIKMKET